MNRFFRFCAVIIALITTQVMGKVTAETMITPEIEESAVMFKDQYIIVHVPKGYCAGIKLVPKRGIKIDNLLLFASAINGETKSARGSVRMEEMPIVTVKADSASQYRITVYKLDPVTKLPLGAIRAFQVFEKPTVVLGKCDEIRIDSQPVSFAPLLMQSKNTIPPHVRTAMYVGAAVLGLTAVGTAGYLGYTYWNQPSYLHTDTASKNARSALNKNQDLVKHDEKGYIVANKSVYAQTQ